MVRALTPNNNYSLGGTISECNKEASNLSCIYPKWMNLDEAEAKPHPSQRLETRTLTNCGLLLVSEEVTSLYHSLLSRNQHFH